MKNKSMLAPRIMIAGTNSGSGKTTVVCGLLQALKNRNINIAAFKCGPDFIDPSFYREIIGTKCTNIDLFFQTENMAKNIVSEYVDDIEVVVIEGVMGYYDGIGGNTSEASAYSVACTFNCDAVLVVDVKGASLSTAAIIQGFKNFKPESHIKGVILNKCTKMQYSLVKEVIEKYADVEVLGYLPFNEEYSFESRHLGLINAFEIENLYSKLQILANQMELTVDINRIINIAQHSEPLIYDELEIKKVVDDKPVISIAKDEAFSFYYNENISLLEKLGAKIKYFSPIHDSYLPEDTSAIYIGGGYPELHLDELESNTTMKKDIKKLADEGIPIYAECGGFMYLTNEIEGKKMVGVINAESRNTGKLGRFGYINITALEDNIMCFGGESIAAHEFHYFDTTGNGISFKAQKPLSKRAWNCIHAKDNLFVGFPHLYLYSNITFAKNFVIRAKEYSRLKWNI